MAITVILKRDGYGRAVTTDVYDDAEFYAIRDGGHLVVYETQNKLSDAFGVYAPGQWVAASIGDKRREVGTGI